MSERGGVIGLFEELTGGGETDGDTGGDVGGGDTAAAGAKTSP